VLRLKIFLREILLMLMKKHIYTSIYYRLIIVWFQVSIDKCKVFDYNAVSKKKYAALILFFLFSILTKAASVKGFVTDAKDKEGLIGATVFNKDNIKMADVAALNGAYHIKNLEPGTYTIKAQYIGYVAQEQTITIKDKNESIRLDFSLQADAVTLGEAVVQESVDKQSDSYARDYEKQSNNIMNIMSAKTIQLLPDLTVGNVLQRVSGVTVEKTANGDGRYATIRGMDKRYNYTMINGIKIPSPDNHNRYVPMDIFPADILGRLEVIKSLTPNLEGDAIGGVMNLVLKEAPPKFICSANVGTQYSQTLFDRSFQQYNTSPIYNRSPEQINGPAYSAKVSDFPLQTLDYKSIQPLPNLIAGFTIGNRFFKDKLGLLFSGSYQDTYSGSSAIFMIPDRQPGYVPANSPGFTDVEVRSYSLHQKRGAAHILVDYAFNPKHKISVYSLYTSQEQIRQRYTSDTVVAVNLGEVDKKWQSWTIQQSIYNSSLKGIDTIAKNLCVNWSAAYSKAWANTPDWTTFSTTGNDITNSLLVNKMTRIWQNNSDQDISGFVNLSYKIQIKKNIFDKIFGEDGIDLMAGAMNRNKNRDSYYEEYDFNFVPTNGVNQPFTTRDNAVWTIVNPTGTPQNANNYNFQENVNAYYGMAKFSLGSRINLLGGVRMENTSQIYRTSVPVTIPGQTGTKQYSDILPSGQIKFKINAKQNLRASYFASITRPSFYDLVPISITTEYFTYVGNPFLKHTQADNYDLRYEFFPSPSEQILVGAFYKNIYNAIESHFVPGAGPSAEYISPLNISNPATNFGFEFVFNKFFGHFGVGANYTYTQSRVVDSTKLYYHDPVLGNTNKLVAEVRPLQGQAKNIANLSFMYKNPKIGLDVLVSAVYTGLMISQVSPSYGLHYWQMPMTRLDFSCEKKLSKKINLSLYVKINNILNTPLTVRIMQPLPSVYAKPGLSYLPEQTTNKSVLVQKEIYGQSYLMGIRYKF
jgi:outer membrane receptor protein involved in Fe transport